MGACSPRGPPCLVWAISGPPRCFVLARIHLCSSGKGSVWYMVVNMCGLYQRTHCTKSHAKDCISVHCSAVHTGICRIVHCAGMKWLRGRPGGLTAGASLGAGSCHQTNTTTVSSPVHFCPVLSAFCPVFSVHSAFLPSSKCMYRALCTTTVSNTYDKHCVLHSQVSRYYFKSA